jgi:exonuclease VII large subunit
MNETLTGPGTALIELIAANGTERREAILAQAREQARERVRNAFREARRRVAHAIAAERQRARGLLASHEARLATQDRQRYQDSLQHLLARARHRLDAALLERWARNDSRRQWLEHLLEQALRRLPGAPWEIAHPAGWDAAEIAHWDAPIRSLTGSAPRLRADPALRAGLRILAGGACLDGSLEGLLADERAIQAQLLARLEAALPDTETGADHE